MKLPPFFGMLCTPNFGSKVVCSGNYLPGSWPKPCIVPANFRFYSTNGKVRDKINK